ncbi:unnamed protein product [Dibothriocephalus latus]|uniref:Uncharacterized protein n=1 Tax=Dibothriocephalus latus TaxID=60516 RepID=A0A3P7N356_DIBLA|nr:unnamed protein product [Dibothriocephalus latus]
MLTLCYGFSCKAPLLKKPKPSCRRVRKLKRLHRGPEFQELAKVAQQATEDLTVAQANLEASKLFLHEIVCL